MEDSYALFLEFRKITFEKFNIPVVICSSESHFPDDSRHFLLLNLFMKIYGI